MNLGLFVVVRRRSSSFVDCSLFVVLAAFVAFVDAMPKKHNFREAATINERIESAVGEAKTVLDEMKTIQAGMKTVQDEILTSVRKLEAGSWKLEAGSPRLGPGNKDQQVRRQRLGGEGQEARAKRPGSQRAKRPEAETINERIESAVGEAKTVLDEMKTIQAGMKTVQDEILTSVRKLETGSWKLESPNKSDIEKGVRLVDANGKIGFSGRLEVYRDGEWGTVCDDGLDSEGQNLATVVCRMLGRTGGTVQLGGRTHTAGSGTIHLDDVKCDGTELSIFDCPHTTTTNCSHSEDAGVTCN